MMLTKKLLSSLAMFIPVLSVVTGMMTGVSAAQTSQLAPAVIAFIDYQKVLSESAAAKDVRRQIQVFRNEYQAELAKSEKTLRAEEQELKRQRPLLSAEVFETKRRAFEDSVARVQRSVQDRNRVLDRSYSEAMNQVSVMVRKIVADMSEGLGFNYVVERTQIMFAKRDFNITKQVLTQLNTKLPTIKVPRPVLQAQ
jgi:outer membrane protein